MLGDKKIVILGIIDKSGRSYKDLSRRVLNHQILITKLMKEGTCVVGRKTQELTGWKGKGLWVLTKKKKWTRNRVNVTHSIDDLRLHVESDTIYVLGGSSVAIQFEPFADEFMIWTINSSDGNEDWAHMQSSKFTPSDYNSEAGWSFVHYKRNYLK